MILVLNSGTFGKNLKYLRETKHLSQTELANILGIYPEAIQYLEAGTILDLDSKLFRKVCTYFQVGMMAIMDDDLQEDDRLHRAHREDLQGLEGYREYCMRSLKQKK